MHARTHFSFVDGLGCIFTYWVFRPFKSTSVFDFQQPPAYEERGLNIITKYEGKGNLGPFLCFPADECQKITSQDFLCLCLVLLFDFYIFQMKSNLERVVVSNLSKLIVDKVQEKNSIDA